MNAGERMVRAAGGTALAAAWWFLIAWIGGFRHAGWIVGLGAIVWGAFLLSMVAVVLGSKRTGPEDGMGRGCSWIIVWIIAAAIGLLGVFEFFGFWLWADVLALLALWAAFMLLVQAVWFARRKARMKRLQRQAAAGEP